MIDCPGLVAAYQAYRQSQAFQARRQNIALDGDAERSIIIIMLIEVLLYFRPIILFGSLRPRESRVSV